MDVALRSLQQRIGASDEGHYPWRWSLERLLRGLSTERSCSADSFTDCWLVDQLASWNKALRATRLVLTEFEPGKLCLRSYDDRDDYGARYRGGGNENDGAFLLAWLPRHHQCIHEVLVYDRTQFERLSFVSSFIVGPAPNLRRVVLHPRYRLEPESGFLEAFGPPQCLRELDLTNVNVSDGLAPKVADVLRGNAPTLRSVKLVGNQLSPESAGTLLLALVACERLKDFALQDSTKSSACDAMAEVFRSNRVIQKVSLVGLCKAGMSCKHLNYSFASGRRVCLHCLSDLFAALEGGLSFQDLTLEATSIGDTMGEALAQFLIKHHPLQTLSLLNCSFDITGATHIAKALSANCTLEHLNLHNCSLEADIVSMLCSGLPANMTLKSLVLPEISSTSRIIQEANPTLELLRLESPGRIQFPLFVHLPSFVSPSLAQALGCAAKVKICHWGFVGDALCAVYASLALNHSLRSLHIDYMGGGTADDGTTPGALISALSSALKACGRFQTFHLDLHRAYDESEEIAPLLADVFDALTHNPRLRKLSLVTSRLTLKTAQSLSVLVAQCKRSLVELHIASIDNMADVVIGVLHKMVVKNVFLSRISVRCSAWDDVVRSSAAMDDAKESNRGLLNKAARFVMSLDGGPVLSAENRCAAAFDELSDAASLREHLVVLSGKCEGDVSLDIKRARCYLQENYMVFAGIVQAAVTCEGDDSSAQLDSLNVDCWRAIAQYLKLSDVVQ
uniref:Ran gtpase-activating protein n=1 Tax=Amblyomma aureolatum TaxID=187763 RepID=A0A1E1XDG9_9ACAR